MAEVLSAQRLPHDRDGSKDSFRNTGISSLKLSQQKSPWDRVEARQTNHSRIPSSCRVSAGTWQFQRTSAGMCQASRYMTFESIQSRWLGQCNCTVSSPPMTTATLPRLLVNPRSVRNPLEEIFSVCVRAPYKRNRDLLPQRCKE